MPEMPTYRAIHLRLPRRRGKARNFSCAHCGGRAHEWAYDQADPNEIVEEHRGWMLRYSADLSHYIPLCRSCHRKFDRVPVTHCKNDHEFTPGNTYIKPNGYRACRACNADAARRYQERLAKA